jgi:phosphoribosylglycinamide formyltransferase-1
VENRPDPLAVLISGRGSNLRALIDATGDGRLDATVALVISNRGEAPGLEHARSAGIETLVMPHGAYPSRDAYDRALATEVKKRDLGVVCLAGFMRLLGRSFCEAFPNAILNIHPSLLPAFPGPHAQHRALDHGVRVTGATVHFVTPEVDAGPIVLQASVPVQDDDTPDSLAGRILVVEHRLYPEAVQRILHGRWRIEGRRVIFDRVQ